MAVSILTAAPIYSMHDLLGGTKKEAFCIIYWSTVQNFEWILFYKMRTLGLMYFL